MKVMKPIFDIKTSSMIIKSNAVQENNKRLRKKNRSKRIREEKKNEMGLRVLLSLLKEELV
jgi:hypothetical protein